MRTSALIGSGLLALAAMIIIAVAPAVTGAQVSRTVAQALETSLSEDELTGKRLEFAGGKMSFVQTGQHLVPEGETEVRDLYIWAQSLDIEGTLDGDVLAWVQSGDISGVVTQDVNLFAQDLHVTGEIHDDLRVFCQNLYIDGTVRGDVLGLAMNITLTENAVIEGSLLAGSGMATLDGSIGGDAMVVGGAISMDGSIAGNAELLTDGGLSLGENARIGGDLHYRGPAEIEFQRGIVKGTITFKPEETKVKAEFDIPRALKLAFHVFLFIAAIIAGTIVVALTKDHARRTADTIRTKPLKSLGIGFIAFICIPILILITFALILTIPLSMMLLLGYLIALYIAKFYVAVWLGNLILRRNGDPERSLIPGLLLGLVIVYLVTAIPVAGTLIGIIIIFLGLGALLQRKETRLDTAFGQPVQANGLPNSFPGAATEAPLDGQE